MTENADSTPKTSKPSSEGPTESRRRGDLIKAVALAVSLVGMIATSVGWAVSYGAMQEKAANAEENNREQWRVIGQQTTKISMLSDRVAKLEGRHSGR